MTGSVQNDNSKESVQIGGFVASGFWGWAPWGGWDVPHVSEFQAARLCFWQGHVCDFMITVPVGNTQDIEAMGEWIRTNRERLTPMLVVSNRAPSGQRRGSGERHWGNLIRA